MPTDELVADWTTGEWTLRTRSELAWSAPPPWLDVSYGADGYARLAGGEKVALGHLQVITVGHGPGGGRPESAVFWVEPPIDRATWVALGGPSGWWIDTEHGRVDGLSDAEAVAVAVEAHLEAGRAHVDLSRFEDDVISSLNAGERVVLQHAGPDCVYRLTRERPPAAGPAVPVVLPDGQRDDFERADTVTPANAVRAARTFVATGTLADWLDWDLV